MLSYKSLMKIHDIVAAQTKSKFDAAGAIAPALMLLQTSEDGVVERAAELPARSIEAFYSGKGAHKDMLGSLIRDLLDEGGHAHEIVQDSTGINANLVVQIAEAWMVASRERDVLNRVMKADTIANEPTRQEIVMILMHQTDGSIPVHHHIRNTPVRHCELVPFPTEKTVSDLLARSSGRFMMQNSPRPGENMH